MSKTSPAADEHEAAEDEQPATSLNSDGTSATATAETAPDDSQGADGTPPLPAKKTAGEVLGNLCTSVDQLGFRLDGVDDFVRICKDKLLRDADAYRLEGGMPMLESFMQVHDLLFRRLQAMESGEVRPDPFLLNVLEMIESELATNGFEVIRPHPGDEADAKVMKYINFMPCPFWRKADRVARVHTCGFAADQESGTQVIRKATVTVYRK